MDFKAGEILAGGDLNYVCNPAADRSGRNHSNTARDDGNRQGYSGFSRHRPPNDRSPLPPLLESFGLVDVWRALYPSAHQYTYFSSVHSTYSRIDSVLASKALFGEVFSADIGMRSLSDHAWVGVFF